MLTVFFFHLLLPVPELYFSAVFAISPLPAVIDWATQTIGRRESSNHIRLLTGYLLGIGFGLFLVSLAKGNLSVFGAGVFMLYLLLTTFVRFYRDRDKQGLVCS